MISADVVPPGLESAGNAFEHPEVRFRLRLACQPECRSPGLIHRHAFGDELVPAKQAVNELAGAGGMRFQEIEQYLFH